MARKAVTSNATDIKDTPGLEYRGLFTGSKVIETKLGEQTLWIFQDDNHQVFSVYGFTNLNRAMEAVVPGTYLYITYTGTKKVQTKYGMKDVHQVEVSMEVPDTEVGEVLGK